MLTIIYNNNYINIPHRKTTKNQEHGIKNHKKRNFVILETLMFAIIVLICIKPITNNIKCFYNGNSLNKETKYDWINGQCQIEFGTGKNGKPTYVPYERIRGNSTTDSPEDSAE